MLTGLTLKYDTLDNWTEFLKINSHTPLCQVVGKNGKGKLNPIILAALSPFLKEMLSSLPPYIEGCIILPDIEFSDISVFLGSLSQSNENFTVTKSLVTTLGINLDHFNEVTVRNLVKEKFVFKNFENKYNNREDSLEYDTENEQLQNTYSNNQEILEDLYPTFIEDNKEDIIIETKSGKKLNFENEIYEFKEEFCPEPEFENDWIASDNGVIDSSIEEKLSDQTDTKLNELVEISNLNKNEIAAKDKIFKDEKFSNHKQTDSYDFSIHFNPEEGNNTDRIIENIDDKRTSHSDSHKVFMCSFCPKTFRTGASTIIHENTHNGIVGDGEVPGEKSRKRKAKSKKHIVRKAFDEIKKKEMANSTKSFEEKESIEYLFETCEFCEKKYATNSKLRSHQLKYHPGKILNLKTASTERFKYKTDVKSKHFEKINGLICCAYEQCSKSFKRIIGAYAHYEGVHIGELVYPCDLCDKVYKSLHIWRSHLSQQHYAQQDGKATCELCGGCYVSKKAMRHHKRTYHPEHPQIFVCSYCPKTFKTRGTIGVHEKSHTGAKRVACYVCGKSVYSKVGLEKHIKNKHEKMESTETRGVKNRKRISNSTGGYKNDLSQVRFEKQGGRFHCKQPKCFQSMGNHQRAIRHHEEVHIGLSLYPCDQCEKVLTSLHGLNIHKYKDHIKGTDATVKCEFCGKDWISEARKRHHITKYHKNAKQIKVT